MLSPKVLRQSLGYFELLGVVLTIALLPIDRFPYIHHTPFKLGAISFILLAAAAALRLLSCLLAKNWQKIKRYTFIGVLFALPVIGYAQSIPYATDRLLAVGATKLLLIAVLKGFCLFVLVSENPQLWLVIKRTVYAVTSVVVAFGFFQFIFDIFGASQRITDLGSCCTSNSTYVFPRVHSVALEPLYLANFLLLPLWLMIHDFYANQKNRSNKLLIGLLAATMAIFLLTTSRSALLGLLVGLAFFFGGIQKGRLKKLLARSYRVFIGIFISVVLLVMLSGTASLFIHKHALNGADSGIGGSVQLFSSHSLNVADSSAKTRYALWPKAFSLFGQHPLRGTGAYNSRVTLNYDQYIHGVQDIKLQPFNNDLLGLLVDLGLIGIVAFAPIIFSLFKAMYRMFKSSWKNRISPAALALIGMLIQSNFFHSLLLARFWVVVGLVLLGLYKLPEVRTAE